MCTGPVLDVCVGPVLGFLDGSEGSRDGPGWGTVKAERPAVLCAGVPVDWPKGGVAR